MVFQLSAFWPRCEGLREHMKRHMGQGSHVAKSRCTEGERLEAFRGMGNIGTFDRWTGGFRTYLFVSVNQAASILLPHYALRAVPSVLGSLWSNRPLPQKLRLTRIARDERQFV